MLAVLLLAITRDALHVGDRRLMLWLVDSHAAGKDVPDSPAVWAKRIDNVRQHRANITGISPCIHGIDSDGKFGMQGQASYESIAPYLPQYAAMGLEIVPIIYHVGGLNGMAAAIKNPDNFISAAVTMALRSNYSGYNIDNELRGSFDPKTWTYLDEYSQPWMQFVDRFADALHTHNKTLSIDIAGCCGWVDALHPTSPAGHCAGAFSTHEFVSTTCPQYKASHLDRVYGMSTYSGAINGPSNSSGPSILRNIANATLAGVGHDKYALGFKHGWPFCANYSDPDTCVLDEEAKDSIRYIRDTLNVTHTAHWCDAPASQAAWDAWGFFLHGV